MAKKTQTPPVQNELVEAAAIPTPADPLPKMAAVIELALDAGITSGAEAWKWAEAQYPEATKTYKFVSWQASFSVKSKARAEKSGTTSNKKARPTTPITLPTMEQGLRIQAITAGMGLDLEELKETITTIHNLANEIGGSVETLLLVIDSILKFRAN